MEWRSEGEGIAVRGTGVPAMEEEAPVKKWGR